MKSCRPWAEPSQSGAKVEAGRYVQTEIDVDHRDDLKTVSDTNRV